MDVEGLVDVERPGDSKVLVDGPYEGGPVAVDDTEEVELAVEEDEDRLEPIDEEEDEDDAGGPYSGGPSTE